MRDGVIIVAGNAGMHVGYHALGGTIYINGNAESISDWDHQGNNVSKIIVRGSVLQYVDDNELGKTLKYQKTCRSSAWKRFPVLKSKDTSLSQRENTVQAMGDLLKTFSGCHAT